MGGDLATELTGLERAFWAAATDPDFYRKHVADDALLVFPYGVGVMDKAMVVYAVEAAAEGWAGYSLSEISVAPLGGDAAVITYKAVAERSGGEPFKAFVSSTYVRRGGRWLLAFHQQTLASTGVAR